MSLSSMSMSTCSQTVDDRWKQRSSVPVLGGIPERLTRGDQADPRPTARSFRIRYSDVSQNQSRFE
ncbi:unnamed protein product [Nippostrongylus brasiliensis]|nr:unnamed protein product [Nippostrongylus brasiliensis]